jgi:hypothetical protein
MAAALYRSHRPLIRVETLTRHGGVLRGRLGFIYIESDGRNRTRIALPLTFSMPIGTGPRVNEAAVLAVASEAFAGRQRVWVAGEYEGPFVKMLIEYRDEDGRAVPSGRPIFAAIEMPMSANSESAVSWPKRSPVAVAVCALAKRGKPIWNANEWERCRIRMAITRARDSRRHIEAPAEHATHERSSVPRNSTYGTKRRKVDRWDLGSIEERA